MNKYLKIIVTVALCGCCLSAMASAKFILEYKLSEEQRNALIAAHPTANSEEINMLIAKELIKKLSQEKIDALVAAANKVKGNSLEKIQIIHSGAVGNSAHVITLSEDLNKEQTQQFINEVARFGNVASIEEAGLVYI